ncbi:hypothetical protein EON63_13810 [archaeon]|nr:MAG: hypothetical protein EON63_13810 [archaeon]
MGMDIGMGMGYLRILVLYADVYLRYSLPFCTPAISSNTYVHHFAMPLEQAFLLVVMLLLFR